MSHARQRRCSCEQVITFLIRVLLCDESAANLLPFFRLHPARFDNLGLGVNFGEYQIMSFLGISLDLQRIAMRQFLIPSVLR